VIAADSSIFKQALSPAFFDDAHNQGDIFQTTFTNKAGYTYLTAFNLDTYFDILKFSSESNLQANRLNGTGSLWLKPVGSLSNWRPFFETNGHIK